MKTLFATLSLALLLPVWVLGQKVFDVRVEQALVPGDTLKLTIIAEKTSGPDFNIRLGDFGLFVDTANLDIDNARIASPTFDLVFPTGPSDPVNAPATSFATGPDYVYVNKKTAIVNNVFQPTAIPISSTPTIIEEIYIPITNPAGTNTTTWRLGPMAIITDDQRDGKAIGNFINPPPNFALDSPCDIQVSASATNDTVLLGWVTKKSKLKTQVTDANGPVSYLWSNGATTANTIVEPTVTTTYTVTATDTLGCQDSAAVTVVVEDVRCGRRNNKVLVCKTGFFSNQPKTICVNKFAAFILTLFGADIGPCPVTPTHKSAPAEPQPEELVEQATADQRVKLLDLEFAVFPNPTNGLVNLAWKASNETSTCFVDVYSTTGQLVLSQQLSCAQSGQTAIDLSENANGLYIVNLTLESGEVVSKELLLTK